MRRIGPLQLQPMRPKCQVKHTVARSRQEFSANLSKVSKKKFRHQMWGFSETGNSAGFYFLNLCWTIIFSLFLGLAKFRIGLPWVCLHIFSGAYVLSRQTPACLITRKKNGYWGVASSEASEWKLITIFGKHISAAAQIYIKTFSSVSNIQVGTENMGSVVVLKNPQALLGYIAYTGTVQYSVHWYTGTVQYSVHFCPSGASTR